MDYKILFPSSLIIGLLVITFGTFEPLQPIMFSADWWAIDIRSLHDIPILIEQGDNYKIEEIGRYEDGKIMRFITSPNYDITSLPDNRIEWDINNVPDSAIIRDMD